MNLMFSLFAFCVGIAIYFALPFEPAIAFPLLIAVLCAANFVIFRKKSIAPVFAFLFGFFYCAAFVRLIDIPRLTSPKRDIEISGVVKNIDYTPDKARVFLQDSATGAIYRLSVSEEIPIPSIAANINATATLFQPSPADVPGGFDSAEWAYFDGITATGYISELKINSNVKTSGIKTFRDYLHNKLDSKLFDTLVLGYKHALTDEETDVWKAAGISHVFSISGFHITLVGGWLFALFYFLFRLIPWITKRTSARYPAMICSFSGLLFYLFLSGADVATQRAFLTTSLMFAAFILGRNVFTIRNTALVFAALLITNPHYLVQPGFQLSFAAIFGLLWFFTDTKYEKLSLPMKVWRAIKIMILTTFIATIFTMPFIAYHFHTIQIYSLLGNLLCLPIFSLLIMPLTMLGLTSYAAAVYNWTFGIANWIATLPYAQIQIPNIPALALILMAVGLICLIIIKNRKIKFPLFAMLYLTSIILVATKPKPIFYASVNHELIAVVQNDELYFNRNKSSNNYFAFDAWKQNNFEKTGAPNKRIKCVKGLCIIQTEKWSLAYTQKFMPLLNSIGKMCAENDFIISYLDITADKNCHTKILHGGLVIYKSGRIEYVTANRWWHIRPIQNTNQQLAP